MSATTARPMMIRMYFREIVFSRTKTFSLMSRVRSPASSFASGSFKYLSTNAVGEKRDFSTVLSPSPEAPSTSNVRSGPVRPSINFVLAPSWSFVIFFPPRNVPLVLLRSLAHHRSFS